MFFIWRRIVRIYLIGSVTVMWLTLSDVAAWSSSAPHFGNEVALLLVGELFDEVGNAAFPHFHDLSGQGNLVVSRTDHNYLGQYTGSTLYVWDIRQFRFDSALIRPDPVATLDVSTVHFQPDFAISPDDRFVAVQGENELRIFNLPDLTLYKALPTPNLTGLGQMIGKELAWSLDNQFLAALFGTEIVVWELENNFVFRQMMDYEITPNYYYIAIQNVEGGWLITGFYQDPSLAFMFCERSLDTCLSYEFENQGNEVVSPDGNVVLTKRFIATATDAIVGIWTRDINGRYVLSDENFSAETFPRAFSPSGRYLFARLESVQQVIVPQWAILDFDTRSPVYSATLTRPYPPPPAWLPDEQYFLSQRLKVVREREPIWVRNIVVGSDGLVNGKR